MHQKQRLRNAYDRFESLVPNQKSEVQNVSLNFLSLKYLEIKVKKLDVKYSTLS